MGDQSKTSRLVYLLGEMRRQMNGAVVGGMRFYGNEYGLNYGVSLATVRAIAKAEGLNHSLAHLLYKQEVRELKLAALWIADSSLLSEELDFWAKGIINSEIAEEAAFALLYRCEGCDMWLESDDELLQYCAVMSLSKREGVILRDYQTRLLNLLGGEVHILQNAVVALLDASLRQGGGGKAATSTNLSDVEHLLASLPDNGASNFIREEIRWRIDLL